MERRRTILVDSNLLVLLVVGATDRMFIARHRRTKAFTEADYDLLNKCLDGFQEIVVTPNVLTEASNLSMQTAEPIRSQVMMKFAAIIPQLAERYIPSHGATSQAGFPRFGLADCATLEAASAVDCTVTADLDLYLQLLTQGDAVVNFHHLRAESLG